MMPADVPAPPTLTLEHLAFGWPGQPPLLQVPALALAPGERVFLRGASGSGKSTLLGLVTGVLQPSAGTVRVAGQDLAALAPGGRDRFRGDHIGYVFQSFNLVPYLDVIENVLLPLRFAPLRAQRAGMQPRGEAARLLAALGLADPALHRQPVTRLSIGQQQRVAVARALLGRPQLVVADEPTSALDADARALFIELLLAESTAAGSALLFASHDAALAPHFHREIRMSEFAP